MPEKNKVDAVIDEVLESKRIRQGYIGFLTAVRFISLLSLCFFILLPVFHSGGVRIVLCMVYAVISLIVYVITTKNIQKR